MPRTYQVISADCHLEVPPDDFVGYVPERFRDRAPRRIQTGDGGDSWLIEGVALVLDRSGSMNDDAGDATTKVQKLREAANVFVSLLLPRHGIGVVRFRNEILNQTGETVAVSECPIMFRMREAG